MIDIHDKTFTPFISQKDLETRIAELAAVINKDYENTNPMFLVVLNGAFVFAADLLKKVTLPCEVAFIRFSSYSKTQSTGNVKEIIGLDQNIEGRDIVIIEDIVDTGLTMNALLKKVEILSPKSIHIATLLHKPEALKVPVQLQYVGFEIADKFVVGYGLDYDGLGRNLDALYVLA